MNKRFLFLLLVLIILIVVLITMGIFSFLNKNKSQIVEIIEIRTFSEIPGFSFEYPIFKDWEPIGKNKMGDNEYYIAFKVTSVKNPKIIITERQDSRPISPNVSYNANKVPYIYEKEELSGGDYTPSHYAYVVFYGEGLNYWVRLDGISEEGGFPVDRFFKKVIETFTFN